MVRQVSEAHKAAEELLARAFPNFERSANGAAFIKPLREYFQQEFTTAESQRKLAEAVGKARKRLQEIGLATGQDY